MTPDLSYYWEGARKYRARKDYNKWDEEKKDVYAAQMYSLDYCCTYTRAAR